MPPGNVGTRETQTQGKPRRRRSGCPTQDSYVSSSTPVTITLGVSCQTEESTGHEGKQSALLSLVCSVRRAFSFVVLCHGALRASKGYH